MEISELDFKNMEELQGSITILTTKETTNEIMLSLDVASKEKISKLLISGMVTRDVQDLHINELSIKKSDVELLTKGQSPWIKTDKGYALSTQPRSVPHFSCKFKTIITSKHDPQTYIAIEITLGNFSFDFSNSQNSESESDDYTFYENVDLTIYTSNNTIKILE